MSTEIQKVIESSHLFAGLAPGLIREIASTASKKSFGSHQYLFQKGDTADALWGVLSGRIDIQVSTDDGKEMVLDTFKPGDVFGEVGVLDFGPRRVDAIAVTNSELFRLERKHFLQFLQSSPEFCFRVFSLLCSDLRDTTEALEDSALYTLPGRLARRLVLLAGEETNEDVQGHPLLDVSQNDLARTLGVHRQTVNRQLRDWEKRGWLTLKREQIVLLDQNALEKLLPPGRIGKPGNDNWARESLADIPPTGFTSEEKIEAGQEQAKLRLAGILAVDAADYSKSLITDAAGTLELLRVGLRAIDKAVLDGGGRMVSHTGDRVLAEFPTASQAVQAALVIQNRTRDSGKSMGSGQPSMFRIGTHHGEVLAGEGEFFGEAVNVAIHLTRFSVAGGVCFSGQVLDELELPPALEIQHLGNHQLENVAGLVSVYSAHSIPVLRRARLRIQALVPPQFRVATMAGLMTIVGIVIWFAGEQFGTKELPTNQWEDSIAVLPFVNMSDDPGNEYFADGLSEEILNLLAKIPGLKVIGRTSSFSFKGSNDDLRLIGKTLGVKTVLEGSVRKSGELVRVTAQLVDVSDGTHIWSESYDRTVTDIFSVQDDIAAAIIDALQIHVDMNPTHERPTENMEAYALFLKARALLHFLHPVDDQNPIELLLKAIEIDPKFAEAHELLAAAYFSHGGANIKAAVGQKLMGEAAAKALVIDPNLVFARALYEMGNLENWSSAREIEALERATRAQPSNPDLLNELAFDLFGAGYLREALSIAERAVDLDPLSNAANYRLFEALFAVGSTSKAIVALELQVQLGDEYATKVLGIIDLAEMRDDIAIAYLEAYEQQLDRPDPTWVREWVTSARDPATGQTYLDRHIPQVVASWSFPEERAWCEQLCMAEWYLYFGYLDRYFELILASDLSASTWNDAENFIRNGTIFRRLGFTAHPKYLEVAEATGIMEVWEQRGPPDFCEKVDGQWVCE